ncbi:hypothetical protein [Sphingopyxis sp.]|jgi:hypothetical protein|uniref:hypothetical protein n=1 Tax=Sphingopyxis sp. TaxID=1908224 RepID=UPI002DF122A5|nr:hypothetical protein [Sphingopyxis sp.]
MQSLAHLFESYASRSDARWWIGARPEGHAGDIPAMIANKIGYPTARDNPFVYNGLPELNRVQAAHVLAVAGTVSLAYGQADPDANEIDSAKTALREMAHDGVFLSNGLWGSGESMGWNPLTSATFDCGLIGFDAKNAFIFWVEEED